MNRKLSPSDAPSVAANVAATLKAERDRFVALAFCDADVLVELDAELRIVFVAGAITAFVGQGFAALRGQAFLDIVAVADRAMVGEALTLARQGQRLAGLAVHLAGPTGSSPPLTLLGYCLPDMGGHFFLSLRLGATAPAGDEDNVPRIVSGGDTGLPNGRSFAALVAERAGGLGAAVGDAKRPAFDLSLLKLRGLEEIRRRLDKPGRDRLATALGGALRAPALHGDLAGQFDPESFGVVHPGGFDVAKLETRIGELAREFDPKRAGIDIARATVKMDVADMAETEQVKALVYVVNRFTDGQAGDFTIDSLTSGLGVMIGETVHKIGQFRTVVATADFAMAFQPIVSLATRRIHHFEALARFSNFGSRLSPYEAITFAEQTGLICNFDFAMCTKAVEWVEAQRRRGRAYRLAVNLSGSSIGTPSFVNALHKLLRKHDAVRRQISFEITESARIVDLRGVNRILRGLRAEGHKVCLDDFGAGAAAFQYLRALEVDLVKIDGAYVRDAFKNDKGAAFLKAMAGLCNDLGIATVAEMVEDVGSLAFLRQCGVEYGQGYLFGRPTLDIAAYDGDESAYQPLAQDLPQVGAAQ